MFNNPHTLWIEIIVVIAVVAFLGGLLWRYIYRKKHNLPTGECACCSHTKMNFVKQYHKNYPKK